MERWANISLQICKNIFSYSEFAHFENTLKQQSFSLFPYLTIDIVSIIYLTVRFLQLYGVHTLCCFSLLPVCLHVFPQLCLGGKCFHAQVTAWLQWLQP